MKRALIFILLFISFFAAEKMAHAAQQMPVRQIILFEDVKTGPATGLTVFKGTEPEPFDLEIIGTTNTDFGLHRYIVAKITAYPPPYDLARLRVMRGMSGSPVYIDDKLIGALSRGTSTYVPEPEPMVLITPIEDMLTTKEGVASTAIPQGLLSGRSDGSSKESYGMPGSISGNGNLFRKPFSPFSVTLSSYGTFVPLAHLTLSRGSSVSPKSFFQAGNALEPPAEGGMVTVYYTIGYFTIGVSGTVTHVIARPDDTHEVYAFGHSLSLYGIPLRAMSLPYSHARVVDSIPSLISYKLVNSLPAIAGTVFFDGTYGSYGVAGGMQGDALIPVMVEYEGFVPLERVSASILVAQNRFFIGEFLTFILQLETVEVSLLDIRVDLSLVIEFSNSDEPLVYNDAFMLHAANATMVSVEEQLKKRFIPMLTNSLYGWPRGYIERVNIGLKKSTDVVMDRIGRKSLVTIIDHDGKISEDHKVDKGKNFRVRVRSYRGNEYEMMLPMPDFIQDDELMVTVTGGMNEEFPNLTSIIRDPPIDFNELLHYLNKPAISNTKLYIRFGFMILNKKYFDDAQAFKDLYESEKLTIYVNPLGEEAAQVIMVAEIDCKTPISGRKEFMLEL